MNDFFTSLFWFIILLLIVDSLFLDMLFTTAIAKRISGKNKDD